MNWGDGTVENHVLSRLITRPAENEYPPYSEMYMELVPHDDRVLYHLLENFRKIKSFISALPEDKLYYRYALNRWSIKEILVHLIDGERIFAYRALCYARCERTELPGFDQDRYAQYSGAGERSLESIFEEYEAVRNSTVAMFSAFPEPALARSGTLIDNGHIINRTVKAIVYHIAGHELSHIRIIRERYLNLPAGGEIF